MIAVLALTWALTVFWLALGVNPLHAFPPFPFGLDEFEWGVFAVNWGARLAKLAWVACWLLVIASWGGPVLRWITGSRSLRPGVAAGTRAGLGFGLLGLTLLGLGHVGVIYPPVLLAVAAVPFIAVRGWRLFRLPTLPSGRAEWAWAAVCAVPVLFSLPLVLAPEASWDAMVYHLRFPSFYLIEHKKFLELGSPFSCYPDLMEMHYMLALGLGGGEQAAKYQHAACWLLAARTLFAAVLPFGRTAAWGSVAVWLASPLCMHLAGMSYVDLATSWMTVLAAVTGFGARNPSGWFVAGAFAGLAYATKYTGICAVAGLVAALGLRRPVRTGVRASLWALAGAAAAACAWPLGNILQAGNPLYPYLGAWFGGVSSPGLAYLAHSERHRWDPSPLAWLGDLWYRSVHDEGGWGSPIGPLWLAVFLPALAFCRGAWEPWRFVAAGVVCWIGFPLDSRFFLPLVPAGLVAAAGAWGDRRLRAAYVVALALVLPHNLWSHLFGAVGQYDALQAFTGFRSRASYLRQGLTPQPEYWDGAQEVNRRLPRKARLMMMAAIKSYYIDRRCAVAHQHVDPVPIMREAYGAPTAERLAARMRQQGFTHLVFMERLAEMYPGVNFPEMTEPAFARYVDWLKNWTRFEFRNGEFIVYSIGRNRSPRFIERAPLLEHYIVRMVAERPEEADRALAMLARLVPGSASLDMARAAHIVVSGGGLLEAEALFARACRGRESSSSMWRGRGYVLARMGDRREALRCFLQAVKMSPYDAEARYNMGQVFLELGMRDKALDQLEMAAALEPDRLEFQQAWERAKASPQGR